jgi:hypothetical protein
VKFGGLSKYDAKLRKLAAIHDASERAAFCDALANDATLAAELAAYHWLVLRKVSLNHLKNGVLIPWNEYANIKGQKTGQPEDDLLTTR